MDTRYPPGVMITLTDCTDSAREAEFNRWHDKTLIPHLMTLEYVRYIKRFENVFSNRSTFQGRPKYLMVGEIYRDDLKQAHQEIRQHIAKLTAQGKGFDAMVHLIDNMYGRTGPEFKSKRSGRPVTGIYMVLNYCVDLSREEEFNIWYNEKHGPEALELGIFDTTYRYKVVDFKEPPHPVPYITLYEPSGDPLQARLTWNPDMIKSKWGGDPAWVDLLGVIWTGGFRTIYPGPEK